MNRYYDAEESDAEISDTLATNATTEYISGLMENYDIKDPKGNLNYLAVQNADGADTSSETTATAATEDTER